MVPPVGALPVPIPREAFGSRTWGRVEHTTTAGPKNNFDGSEVKYDPGRMEIIFEENYPCPVRNGDWIIVAAGGNYIFHRTALDVTSLLLIAIQPIHRSIIELWISRSIPQSNCLDLDWAVGKTLLETQ